MKTKNLKRLMLRLHEQNQNLELNPEPNQNPELVQNLELVQNRDQNLKNNFFLFQFTKKKEKHVCA